MPCEEFCYKYTSHINTLRSEKNASLIAAKNEHEKVSHPEARRIKREGSNPDGRKSALRGFSSREPDRANAGLTRWQKMGQAAFFFRLMETSPQLQRMISAAVLRGCNSTKDLQLSHCIVARRSAKAATTSRNSSA